MSKKNSLVFLDVSVDGDPAEKMVFEVVLCFEPILLWICSCADMLVVSSNVSYFVVFYWHLYSWKFGICTIHSLVICNLAAFLWHCSQDCGKFPCTLYRYILWGLYVVVFSLLYSIFNYWHFFHSSIGFLHIKMTTHCVKISVMQNESWSRDW